MTKHYKLSALNAYSTTQVSSQAPSQLGAKDPSKGEHSTASKQMNSSVKSLSQNMIGKLGNETNSNQLQNRAREVNAVIEEEAERQETSFNPQQSESKNSQFQVFMRNLKGNFGENFSQLKEIAQKQYQEKEQQERIKAKHEKMDSQRKPESFVMNDYVLPQAPVEGGYSEELYRMRKKLRDCESKAAEAKHEHQTLKAFILQSQSLGIKGQYSGTALGSQSFSNLLQPSSTSQSLLHKFDGKLSKQSILLQQQQKNAGSLAALMPQNLVGQGIKIPPINMNQLIKEQKAQVRLTHQVASTLRREQSLPATRESMNRRTSYLQKDSAVNASKEPARDQVEEETETLLVEEEYGVQKDRRNAYGTGLELAQPQQRKIVIQQQAQVGGFSPTKRKHSQFFDTRQVQQQLRGSGLNSEAKSFADRRNQDLQVKERSHSTSEHLTIAKNRREKNLSISQALQIAKQSSFPQTLSMNNQLLNSQIQLQPLPVTQYALFPQTSLSKKRPLSIFSQNVPEQIKTQVLESPSQRQNSQNGESSQRLKTAQNKTYVVPIIHQSQSSMDGLLSMQSPIMATNIKIHVKDLRKRNDRNFISTLSFSQDSRSRTSQSRLRLISEQHKGVGQIAEGQVLQALQAVVIDPQASEAAKQVSSTLSPVFSIPQGSTLANHPVKTSLFQQRQKSSETQSRLQTAAQPSSLPSTASRPRQLFQPNVKNLQLKVPSTANSTSQQQIQSPNYNIVITLENPKKKHGHSNQPGFASLKATSQGTRITGNIKFEDDRGQTSQQVYKQALSKILGPPESSSLDHRGKDSFFQKPRISITQSKQGVFKQPHHALPQAQTESGLKQRERSKKRQNSKDSDTQGEGSSEDSDSDSSSERRKGHEDSTSVEGKRGRRRQRAMSGSPDEDGVQLNEEERSLIVDEILRVNQKETKDTDGNLILEDLSDSYSESEQPSKRQAIAFQDGNPESNVVLIGLDGKPIYDLGAFDTRGIAGTTNQGTLTPPSAQYSKSKDSTLLLIQPEQLMGAQTVNINLQNLISTSQATHQWTKHQASLDGGDSIDQKTASLISVEGVHTTKQSHPNLASRRRMGQRKSSRFRLIIQTHEGARAAGGAPSKGKNQMEGSKQSGNHQGPTTQIQLNIFQKKQESMMTNVFEEGIFSAHKMQIVKQTKKEKASQKYLLMKELLRERVSIQRQQHGFQIIIPKSLKTQKGQSAALKPKEFEINNLLKDYNIYNLDFKDLLKLIKKKAIREGSLKPGQKEPQVAGLEGATKAAMKAVFGGGDSTSGRGSRERSLEEEAGKALGPSTTETIISKDQIEIFLKKNLKRLLKLQDPAEMQNQNEVQARLERMQNSQERKGNKEKEKMLRLFQKEEELERKREKAKRERESNQQIRSSAKAQLIDEKRRLIQQQQATMYRVVTVEDSVSSDRDGQQHKGSLLTGGGQSGRRSSLLMSDEKSREGGSSTKDLQMVYATEFKIAERKEEIKKRMEMMRLEKDQEKQRVEKMQIYNFIKERIVRELLINRKLGAYIRDRELNRQSGLDEFANSGSFNTDQLNRWANAQSKYAGYGFGNRSNSNIREGNPKARQLAGRKVMTHENSGEGLDNDELPSPLMYGDPDKFGLQPTGRGHLRHTVMEGAVSQPQIFIKDDKGDIISHTKSVKPPKSRQNSDLMLNKVLNSMEGGGGSGQLKDKSLTPSRNSNETLNVLHAAAAGKTTARKSQQSSRQVRAQSKESSESQDSDEYYEEDPDNLGPPRSIVSKNSSSMLNVKHQFKMQLLNDREKIRDYNLGDNSSQQSSSNFQLPSQSANNQVQMVAGGGVSGAGDLLSMFDSEGDELFMTKEEEVAKINQELQHQRILEKISEKIMSKKISNFKKELLVRIAINLEMMETADLFTLEDLLERYETNDQEVKRLVIELFQEKYAIDLGSDLLAMVEETMNKVKDESKAMRRKNIKELLLKKIRMLNMISRFCKVAARNNDNLNDQKALKELLDEDEDEFYSDEDEGALKQEFQETVNEVLKRIFSQDDQLVSSQLRNFKKNYKMRFGPQPEYLIRDDGEAEAQSQLEQITAQRLKAFRYNEKNMLLVLQEWLHPAEELVAQGLLAESRLSKKKTNKRKYLYDPNAAINEDNLFETFYDLVQEVVNRIKKVQNNIKLNDKNLKHKRGSISLLAEGTTQLKETPREAGLSGGMKVKQVVNLEMLAQRRQMTEQELEERRFCALRIAEFLNSRSMFGYEPPKSKAKAAESEKSPQEEESKARTEGGEVKEIVEEDESEVDDEELRRDLRVAGITNFLDKDISQDKRITRGSIQWLRESAPDFKDPLLHVMAMAFKSYAQLLLNDP